MRALSRKKYSEMPEEEGQAYLAAARVRNGAQYAKKRQRELLEQKEPSDSQVADREDSDTDTE